ncbi:MAG TPA: glycosyltransferase family 39 protein [Candidatus Aquilonibacter sp.]|nr:glycosyltransferase family 39 protein [Candidatus Aquilonibacter sp.]
MSQARRSILQRRDLWTYVLLFAVSLVVFFLCNSRMLNIYDEGILLTGTMRVMHGQVIHRDFYYIYGPAPLYLLAGVFKLFGSSVLAERLVTLIANAGLITSLYALERRLCGRMTAAVATCICAIWMIGVGIEQVLQVPLFALTMLWSTWLVLPVFQGDLRRRRAVAAGLLAGFGTLCRYDYGAGLIACHIVLLLLAVWWRTSGARRSVAATASTLGSYLLGAAILLVPAAIAYLAVAPLHDLLYDIVIYTAKYYRIARELPFPTIHAGSMDEFIAYVLPPALGLCAYLAAFFMLGRRRSEEKQAIPDWVGFTLAFTLIATLMYLKAVVRIGAGSLYLSTVPCVLVTLVLWSRRKRFSPGYRAGLAVMLLLLLVEGVFAVLNQKVLQQRQRASTLAWIVSPRKEAPLPPLTGWCKDPNPITRGFCYIVEDDRIRAIEFLETQTHPGDTIYVGPPRHDRIFANDNVTYFATQRLPATRWSHFDPFLQNRADIQREMIADLERNRPPYIALDSTFVGSHEPNGSSVSTGVHLLDDYIAANYQPVKKFGVITILERRSTEDILPGKP